MGPAYKDYVNLQTDAEAKVRGVLEGHAEAGTNAGLAEALVALLGRLFTPSRYQCHGFQRVEAYIGYTAPSSDIAAAAGFSTSDFLRRVTTIATAPGSCGSPGPSRVLAPPSGHSGKST